MAEVLLLVCEKRNTTLVSILAGLMVCECVCVSEEGLILADSEPV